MNEAARSSHDREETRRHLEGYLQAYPGLRGRVCRILLLHLHTKGYVRIEDVYRRAERAEEWNEPPDPNRPTTRLWAADEKEVINQIVIELASEHMTSDQVDSIVWAAHRRDEAQSLEALARVPDVSLALVAEKVSAFASLPGAKSERGGPEGTLVALIRRVLSERVDYISVAKRYLTMKDIDWVLQRVISTDTRAGRVGGKAAGMLLAWAILRRTEGASVDLPETCFVLTDAYDEFKEINAVTDLGDHKYRALDEIRASFPAILEIFRNAEFPARIADLLRVELDQWGERPLIVRSSSVLEDNFGAAFSGIYRSIFLLNRGPLEDRLQALLGAISEIYAGVFSPDGISYRLRHGLVDHDERMGLMIQPVIGAQYGNYFLPAVAGVAFSRNDYRWSRRIRREDGLVRLVLGLGTHAVDRVGDYARMVPLRVPTMRPEGTPEEIVQSSQRQVDVVDMEGGGFQTVPVHEVLRAMRQAGIADYVSIVEEDGRLSTPVGTKVTARPRDLCVTFDRLLARGEFPKRMSRVLKTLEEAYRVPVDLEFAFHEGNLYILQCRPLGGDVAASGQPVPRDIPRDDLVFSAKRYINPGVVEDIEFVVVIDPRDYHDLDAQRRRQVARTVGRLNDLLNGRTFMLMGPGRWGSQDIRLGIQVSFADICHARVLVEIARREGGYTPEPSFGTHFFQDLVEASIHYLPLYPDDEGVVFDEEFLRNTPNALARLCPEHADLADAVQVIDVAEVRPGRALTLIMDGETQEAVCFLKEGEDG